MIRACLFAVFFLLNSLSGFAAMASPHLPFVFVENRGQAGPECRYIGNGPDFKAWFQDRGAVLQQGNAVVRMDFAGGRADPAIDGEQPLGATANYLRGSDPRRWKTDLPLFAAIRYRGVWPGIDIHFKADEARAKAEYLVAPGASAASIRLRFNGEAAIQSDGSLMVSNTTGVFREDKPILFQNLAAGRTAVEGAFRKLDDGTIGFTVGDYDREKPLIIDPAILFSGYFGDSETTITGVSVTSSYNVVVAGWTLSTDLPASGGARSQNGGGVDAFVAAFSPAGGSLIYCTYLGGSGDDRAFGLAVDASFNTYITGWTSSSNFPLAGAIQSKLGGPRDAFVAKINAAGNTLVYSTYLGGSGSDQGNGIALDSTNSAVIVGDTTSTNLPVTSGTLQSRLAGGQDAFVAKLNPAGSALSFLTYFGGSGTDHGAAIKVDSTNSVYFGGSTFSTNLPTLSAFQPQSGGGQDAFFAKLAPTGASLIFSTYIGGSNGTAGEPEELNAIVLASTGNPTIAGTTSSTNFPVTTNALQSSYGGGQTDGFIMKINGANGALLLSTYLGGSLTDGINGVAVDFRNDTYVAGYTTSTDFPVQNPVQNGNAGQMDAFVAKISFPAIEFATCLGGFGNDSANALAVDAMTSIVVVGTTGSGNFPVAGSIGSSSGGVLSSFITKLAPNFNETVVAPPAFYLDPWHTTGYNGTVRQLSFGLSTDIPVAGDWDGSGVKRIGVFRNGMWLLDINNDGVFDAGDKTVVFGQAGDIPVVGDWTGTGTLKLGLYRAGSFILDLSGHLSGVATGLSDATFPFGLASDIPVTGDWNSSGTSKVGVFRSGSWLVDYNGDRVFNSLDKTYIYGQAGDIPVTGDWDSTGSTKLGVYRSGTWILDYHATGQLTGSLAYALTFTFGSAGYKPLSW